MNNPNPDICSSLCDISSKLQVVGYAVELLYTRYQLDESLTYRDTFCLNGCSLLLRDIQRSVGTLAGVPPCD